MKKTSDAALYLQDEVQAEYNFDYQQAKSNRFAGQVDDTRTVVVLDPELSAVFKTSEEVNNLLRALVKTMPATNRAAVKPARRFAGN
ncbi:MAG: hypothetical protein RBQ99_10425 [Trichlorobacter sp.]|nr:hypothetical protein [Trichlorobacter sp.]